MRIGLFYQIQVPKPWGPTSEADRFYEAIEQVPYAEKMGFESVWFTEHHFRPVWSHNGAPDLAAISQRTSRIRLGIGVVPGADPPSAPCRCADGDTRYPEPWSCGCRLGRTGYPCQLTPYGSDLGDTRRHVARVCRYVAQDLDPGDVFLRRDVFSYPASRGAPKPLQRPHPPLWARLTGENGQLGLGQIEPAAVLGRGVP